MAIDDLLEVLGNDPNIERILPGEEWDFARLENSEGKLDYNKFQDDEYTRKVVQGIYEVVKKDLTSPYIIDKFGDHGDRQKWKTDLWKSNPALHEVLFERNSLKANVLGRLVQCSLALEAYAIDEVKEKVTQYKEELKKIHPQLLDGGDYGTLSTEDKLTFAKDLKQTVYQMLTHFSADE